MEWMFSSVLMTTLEGHVYWIKCNFFGREVGDPLGPIEALSGSKKGSRRSLFYDPYKMRGTFNIPEPGALTQKMDSQHHISPLGPRRFNRKLEEIALERSYF